MLQLKGAKCRFLFCLVICIFICSAIYLKAKVSNSPAIYLKAKVSNSSASQHSPDARHSPDTQLCRPLPPGCRPILGGREGSTWERRDCLTEGYLAAPDLNCSAVTGDLHFITSPLSREEEEYPLAFIVTIHKELEMFARLLRAVYAPQNVYCVHVDAKAEPWYRAAVERLAGCFPNVFLASASERVTYAGFSRLQADINCMRDLARSPVAWRKVVNLCGQDFPIMSNLELVRYLRSEPWRDHNMTPGIKQPPTMRYRTQMQYKEVAGSHVARRGRGYKKGPPPHKLEIYFGTAYYSLTRGFVKYVLNSRVARDLLEWSKDTYSPDEHYWVTLNHIPDAPGGTGALWLQRAVRQEHLRLRDRGPAVDRQQEQQHVRQQVLHAVVPRGHRLHGGVAPAEGAPASRGPREAGVAARRGDRRGRRARQRQRHDRAFLAPADFPPSQPPDRPRSRRRRKPR